MNSNILAATPTGATHWALASEFDSINSIFFRDARYKSAGEQRIMVPDIKILQNLFRLILEFVQGIVVVVVAVHRNLEPDSDAL